MARVSETSQISSETPDQVPWCSQEWDGSEAPVWGTASPATFWLAVEQPGPWGAKALTESRLDPRVGAALQQDTVEAGGRTLLIRAVGDHRTDNSGAPRRVYLAGGAHQGKPWLLQGLFVDPSVLIHLPWEKIAAGDAEAARQILPELSYCRTPVLLICTNGKRDLCCAVRGRKIAAYAAGQRGHLVWECTHTGGHRFAPTGLVLPSGATFARLSTELAVSVVDAAQYGRLPEEALGERHLRGMSHLSGPAQAADAAVRASVRELRPPALQVTALPDDVSPRNLSDDAELSLHRVTHDDGRSWLAAVTALTRPGPAVSCGGAGVPSTSYKVELTEEIPGGGMSSHR
ncbi:hypothetical protein AUCHE_05_05250 [Austwickia chelonae NBRC 105200]|uniref:Sucrase ferredoxin n=1 Tax=Austwickia chelonae NBRC 105200 TaxID=1184607 RepID=K6ULW9_9MICO|nr:hypothetical protein AUCHE_05_05250 [Austwickia chelonae NBRC 105200]